MIVADLLQSYLAAMKIMGKPERQETGPWLNNRAENSHQPFRRRGRAITKLRSMKSLQKFTSIQSLIHNHFN
jgi:putative transposase